MKLLDSSQAHEISEDVMDVMDDQGYEVVCIIPGLIDAIHRYANAAVSQHTTEQLLDEASDLLADGVDND